MSNLLKGLIVSALLLFATSALAESGPEEFVRNLSNDVVAVLSDQNLEREAKLATLKTLLDDAADLPLLAKLILGKHWRTASAQQQEDYVDVFRKLVNKTMADRLSDYGGETINVVGSSEVSGRDTKVNTLVQRPNGAPSIKVDWRVRTTDGKHALIDVEAEGVSLVVTQRSEIGAIVSNEGMDGLIAKLRDRLGENSSG